MLQQWLLMVMQLTIPLIKLFYVMMKILSNAK